MKTVEVHPVEWDAQIVLSYDKSNVGDGLYVGNILAVSTVSETTGRIRKKEDQALELNYMGLDNREYRIRINIDEKYIKKFVDDIEYLKERI